MKRLRSSVKWLYPGMRVKRWLMLSFVGVVLVIVGAAFVANLAYLDWTYMLERNTDFLFSFMGFQMSKSQYVVLGVLIAAIGLAIVLGSIIQFNRSVLAAVAPDVREDLADRIFVRRSLAQGQRIVVVGGGTGLSTMLRGLKEYTTNIVAVVTVTDNGGSSGRLTQQMGVPPPGDLRNCLVALADAEPTLSRLFQYRFDEEQVGLGGHSFGNLFIAAMTSIYNGNYEEAIAATSKVLAIRGRVYPSTTQNVCLLAEMEDGSVVEGETQIAAHPQAIRRMYLRPENARPLAEVLHAIREADAIVLGPGSVYTSVIPNLLVDGVIDAIARSKAIKVYVCNVMTQPGETDNFTASEHVRAVAEHAPGKPIFSHVLVNTQKPSAERLQQYEKYGQCFVEPDLDVIREMGFTPVAGNFISETDVVRHDPTRLAEAMYKIIL
jgi:uncharacterized cofD-like protein